MNLRPQTISLLRAIMAPAGKPSSESISEAAGLITDWNEVFESARRHRVVPLLYSRLAACADVPTETLQVLRSEFERNAFQCMANIAELRSILERFDEAGIRVLPFKGVVLAASAYGDITERVPGDIDLLIEEADLNRATQALFETGYALTTKVKEDGRPELEHYFEYHLEREADGRVVELRWRLELTERRFRKVVGIDWAWPSRKTVNLAGFAVPSLDPIRTIIMLCMHGSKHKWARLMWVCDVARFLDSQPDLDWAAVISEARRTRLLRPLALGVLLANRMAGAEVPRDALKSLERFSSMRSLADYFAEHLIDAPGSLPSRHVPYGIQLLDYRDRTMAMLSPEFLKPNDLDRAAVRLPKRLSALYYAVRPIRILLDRSAR